MTFTATARHASGFNADVLENTLSQAKKPEGFGNSGSGKTRNSTVLLDDGRQPHIVLSTWPAKNGKDTLAHVRSQDPTEESFMVIVARFVENRLDEIKEGAIVLLRKLDNLNLPAIVEVLGVMPMPISLAGLNEELEWNNPEVFLTQKQALEILDGCHYQLMRVMSLLRDKN